MAARFRPAVPKDWMITCTYWYISLYYPSLAYLTSFDSELRIAPKRSSISSHQNQNSPFVDMECFYNIEDRGSIAFDGLQYLNQNLVAIQTGECAHLAAVWWQDLRSRYTRFDFTLHICMYTRAVYPSLSASILYFDA